MVLTSLKTAQGAKLLSGFWRGNPFGSKNPSCLLGCSRGLEFMTCVLSCLGKNGYLQV